MSLHNDLYKEMSILRNDIKAIVNEQLKDSETYQAIQNYIKLANDNSELLAEHIQENNSLCYDGITNIEISFNKESLITSCWEIHIRTYINKTFHHATDVSIDTFIILLNECGLIND